MRQNEKFEEPIDRITSTRPNRIRKGPEPQNPVLRAKRHCHRIAVAVGSPDPRAMFFPAEQED